MTMVTVLMSGHGNDESNHNNRDDLGADEYHYDFDRNCDDGYHYYLSCIMIIIIIVIIVNMNLNMRNNIDMN